MTEPVPLSPEDRMILDMEGPVVAGHACKVIRLEPPGVDFDSFFEMVERRVSSVPELWYRLSDEDGAPCWVSDQRFQLERHLFPWREGEEVAASEVPAITAELFMKRLDRDRPLWAIDVARLADGGTVLVSRTHHALADGTTVMRFAREMLWDEKPGAGAPATPAARQADDTRHEAHLLRVYEHEFVRSEDNSPFDGQIGPDREIAFATVSLGELHDAANKATGAKLNDAVLALLAGAFEHWLEHLDEETPGEIRVKVPVSLHYGDDHAGNRDSFFTVPLPLDEPDPMLRLARIRSESAERKSNHDAETLDRWFQRAAGVSPFLGRLLKRFGADPRRYAVNVSNVRGPGSPVTILGTTVSSIHSVAEIAERHALRVAVISYADQIGFGFCADPELVPELDRIAEGVEVAAGRLIAGAV
ncbi:MAG: DUF1298 domain-containing protein [Thermoleophilia bacterium]|nr:DUF1298 domain-containing protein [Thermoleophilia bacterium]